MLGLSHPPLTVSTEKALWDIQLDVAATSVGTGLAGCYWTGTEFWIAKWASDTIYTANAAGVATGSPFVIAEGLQAHEALHLMVLHCTSGQTILTFTK